MKYKLRKRKFSQNDMCIISWMEVIKKASFLSHLFNFFQLQAWPPHSSEPHWEWNCQPWHHCCLNFILALLKLRFKPWLHLTKTRPQALIVAAHLFFLREHLRRSFNHESDPEHRSTYRPDVYNRPAASLEHTHKWPHTVSFPLYLFSETHTQAHSDTKVYSQCPQGRDRLYNSTPCLVTSAPVLINRNCPAPPDTWIIYTPHRQTRRNTQAKAFTGEHTHLRGRQRTEHSYWHKWKHKLWLFHSVFLAIIIIITATAGCASPKRQSRMNPLKVLLSL